MRVFSNAGPLVVLGKLGQLELLFRLFGQVRLPAAVHREVVLQGLQQSRPDAHLVQRAIQRGLLVVEEEIAEWPADMASLPLDTGEKEAICLALSEPGSLVLLDDLKAREEAKARTRPGCQGDPGGDRAGLPHRAGESRRSGSAISSNYG